MWGIAKGQSLQHSRRVFVYLAGEMSTNQELEKRIAEYVAKGFDCYGYGYASAYPENTYWVFDPDGNRIPGTRVWDAVGENEAWELFFEMIDNLE